MAPKHLKFESASDSEEETPMEVKNQKDPSASSSVVSSQAVKTTADSSSSEEEESSQEEESSDDEGEKPLETKETASQVVVTAAATAKRKAVLSAEEEEDDGDKEKKIKKKATSEVIVVPQARSDMAKKKKEKVTFSNKVVKHQKKKAKTSEEEKVGVVVETVKKEEIGGASSEKNRFKPLLKENDQLRFLQVILDLKNDKGKKPQDDKNGFYKSVTDVVEAKNLSLSQCMRQIETLREKYKKKVSQGKVPSSSSNSHDKRFFELCKEIWGSTFPAVEKTRKSERGIKIKEERDMIDLEQDRGGDLFGKSTDLVRLVTAFGIEEDWMKRMWTSVPTKKKRIMEQKWKVLKKNEFEMVTDKTSFVHEMVSMMSEASTQ